MIRRIHAQKPGVTARDLAEIYTSTPVEQTLAATLTPSVTSQVGFLIVLKTFQRLGLCSAITPSYRLWTITLSARTIIRDHNAA